MGFKDITKQDLKALGINVLVSFAVTIFVYFVYASVIDIKTAEMFSPVIFLLVLIYLEISDKNKNKK